MLCLSFTVRSQCSSESSYLKFTIDRVRASQLRGMRMLIILKFQFKELLYIKYLMLMIYPGFWIRIVSVFCELLDQDPGVKTAL
jgi:hypothetical protein